LFNKITASFPEKKSLTSQGKAKLGQEPREAWLTRGALGATESPAHLRDICTFRIVLPRVKAVARERLREKWVTLATYML
jgi:hypothetical protein